MPQSLSKIYIHLIFSTKNRMRFFDKPIREETFRYIAGTLNTMDCPVITIGGDMDHVHCLFCLNRNKSISEIVREVKTNSTKWIKEKTVHTFNWQAGYGVFSVSQSKLNDVKNYIQNQEEHHRRKSFQEEFLEFLKAYDIEYNSEYVWD